MSDEDFIRLAKKEADKSSEPLKCGSVIVKDGKIIAKTFNSQRSDNNATAHAEIKAIIDAGKKLGSKNLKGCIVYSTHEPCSMCLSALRLAKIKQVFYELPLKDA